MKRLLLLLSIVTVSLSAQPITWVDITASYSLPAGVKLYTGSRVSPALSAWYLDVDMNVASIAVRPYVTSSIDNVANLTTRFGAIASVNGGVFGGTQSYAAVVYPFEVKAQNVSAVTRSAQSFPVIRSFFGVDKNRNMHVNWIYHFDATVGGVYTFAAPLGYVWNDPTPKPAPLLSNGTPYQDLLVGIGGVPTLVKAGAVNITLNEEIVWGSGIANDTTGQDPRTALGYTASKHCIIFVCDGRSVNGSQGLGLGELARVLIGLGCVEAVNLDGGGSTQMAVGGTTINGQNSRAVPSIFSVVLAESLNVPQTPTLEKIIDSGDQGCTFVGTGWFASANSGWYGSTPSMLNAIGTGSAYAVYKFSLPKTTVYSLYGWWVAAGNRSTQTPYIVTHNHITDTVRVDQTSNGSQWTPIGTYTFAGDGTDSVMITNQAATGSYVVVDAIRMVSYDPTITGVVQNEAEPARFALEQNYPNPFNPTTGIRFQVSGISGRWSVVSVRVYDLLGREVAMLVNEEKAPGTYSVTWNAAGMASGVYFCQLKAGGQVSTKKMLLLR